MSAVYQTIIVVLLASVAHAQGAVTATWNPNPESDIAGYRLIIDSTITDVGNVTIYRTGTISAGPHVAAVMAYNTAGLVSAPSSPPVDFTVAQTADPCLPPLGAHAPAVFPTSPTLTGSGKVGSKAFLNYQLGGPDAVVESAVQIDGIDAAVGKGTDLKAFSGMWFTMPATGTHTLGVRVLTSFGCALTRQTAFPLVVKP